jgi:two-component system CheB/CheR fusion protein
LLETTEQFKETKLIIELDDELPNVVINKIQIEQVLINMVQNALDVMSDMVDMPAVLRIRTAYTDDHALRVAVIDQGTGLPLDFEKNIFRPFFTTKKNGMGMGLAISSSIIEAHGGRLEATNNLNRGATFSFMLPLEGDANP